MGRYRSPSGRCEFVGCDRPHKARGYCAAHYDHVRRGNTPKPIGPARYRRESIYDGTRCRVDGCPDRPQFKGCCESHYYVVYKFGIEPEEYGRFLSEQGGGCAICRSSHGGRTGKSNGGNFRLSVDHDHASGRIRGLLCSACNHGLGKFQDDPALLRAAADYLTATRSAIRKVA